MDVPALKNYSIYYFIIVTLKENRDWVHREIEWIEKESRKEFVHLAKTNAATGVLKIVESHLEAQILHWQKQERSVECENKTR